MIWDLVRVWDTGFWVSDLGFRICDLRFMVRDLNRILANPFLQYRLF